MGTRERRDREKQERRAQILDCARKLFWKKGFAGTTIPEIAAATELAPGTLYLYFPSKDALYAELLVDGYDLLIERLRAAVDEPAPPRQAAGKLIQTFFEFAQKHPQYFDVIFFVLQKEGGQPQGVFGEGQLERFTQRENACKEIAANVLGGGGLPREQAALTVEAVWRMLVGMVFYCRGDTAEELAAIAGQAKELILAGMFGSE